MPFIKEVPDEILLKIISKLGPQDFPAAVCYRLKEIASDNLLWKKKVRRHFPHIFEKFAKKIDVNWLECFKQAEKTDYINFTPKDKKLFELTKEGDLDSLIKESLKITDLKKRDAQDVSLLDWILESRHQHILNYLYQQIVEQYSNPSTDKINHRNEKGFTLLHWAVYLNQSVKVIKDLIAAGANINAISNKGETPLWRASLIGNLQTVKLLLEENANLELSKDAHKEPQAAIDHLSSGGHLLALPDDLLHKYFKWLRNGPISPLMAAAIRGHSAVVNLLIDKGADPNAVNRFDATALNYAASFVPATKAIQALIDRGANLNETDRIGCTALMNAAQAGRLDIVKLLIGQGADLNAVNIFGKTALMEIAEQGNVEIAKLLIENGANLDTTDHFFHQTALMIAAKHNHSEFIKLLNDKGSSLHTVDWKGHSAFTTGSPKIKTELSLLAYIRERGAEGEYTGFYRFFKDSFIEKLIKNSHFANLIEPPPNKQQKLDAADALAKVMFEGADPSSLKDHEKALKDGRLKNIYCNYQRNRIT